MRVWPLDGRRVVLLSEGIVTKINLQPSCHRSGYNPVKSIIPALQTLILPQENTANVLCSGGTKLSIVFVLWKVSSTAFRFPDLPGITWRHVAKCSVFVIPVMWR